MVTLRHISTLKALHTIMPHILLNLLQTTIASKSKVFKNALFVNQLKKIDGFKFYVCCRNDPNWFLLVHFFHTEFYKRRSFLGFIYNRIGYTSAIPLKIGFICPRNDLQCNLQSDLQNVSSWIPIRLRRTLGDILTRQKNKPTNLV